MEPQLFDIVWMLISADKKEGAFDATELMRLPKGRGYPSVIPYSKSDAGYLAEHLSARELRHLIRALIRFSAAAGSGRSGGSVSPVIPLYSEYAARYPDLEPELTVWVVEHRVNIYDPFGTPSFADASSLKQHIRLRQERQQLVASEESVRVTARRHTKAVMATERLPSAVRRGDIKAVEAMLAKGADPKVARLKVGTLQGLAREHGRDAMVDYLAGKGIQ